MVKSLNQLQQFQLEYPTKEKGMENQKEILNITEKLMMEIKMHLFIKLFQNANCLNFKFNCSIFDDYNFGRNRLTNRTQSPGRFREKAKSILECHQYFLLKSRQLICPDQTYAYSLINKRTKHFNHHYHHKKVINCE